MGILDDFGLIRFFELAVLSVKEIMRVYFKRTDQFWEAYGSLPFK